MRRSMSRSMRRPRAERSPWLDGLAGAVALLHSPRAARAPCRTGRYAWAVRGSDPHRRDQRSRRRRGGTGWPRMASRRRPPTRAMLAARRACATTGGVRDERASMNDDRRYDSADSGSGRWHIGGDPGHRAFVAGLAAMAWLRSYDRWFGERMVPTGPRPHAAADRPADTVLVAAAREPRRPLPSTSMRRSDALAARMGDLETRAVARSPDAQAASGNATRAEGLLVAFAARRALDRGLRLGYIEDQLRDAFRRDPAARGRHDRQRRERAGDAGGSAGRAGCAGTGAWPTGPARGRLVGRARRSARQPDRHPQDRHAVAPA